MCDGWLDGIRAVPLAVRAKQERATCANVARTYGSPFNSLSVPAMLSFPQASRHLLFTLCICLAGIGLATSVSAQDFDPVGSWEGKLVIPQGTLTVLFHISEGDSGYVATMDSPDQGATGLPISSVTVSGDSLQITADMIQGRYEGTLQVDGTLKGTWSQGPGSLPLRMTRKAKSDDGDGEEIGYNSENLYFKNQVDNIRLAGTLTTPKGDWPFPAVVLVTGSGPQDRDESILGHKPFRVIADHLTKNGIAVLRYDDRGYGLSEGVFANATIEAFARDAEAAVAFLRTRPEVAAGRIGMIGHSEGGIVAPIVAVNNSDLAYVVLLAGPALPGSDILELQTELILTANGVDAEEVARTMDAQKKVFAILKRGDDEANTREELEKVLTAQLNEMSDEERQSMGITEESIGIQIETLTSPWFRHFVNYDPIPVLRQLTCPILALFGEKDLQVPPAENIAAMKKVVDTSGINKIRVMEGLNHLFQHSVTGSPEEYGTIEETIAPEVLEEISTWILATPKAKQVG